MNQITEHVWIGNVEDAAGGDALKAAGITKVLNCAFEIIVNYPAESGITGIKFGMTDDMNNPPHIKMLAVETLKGLIRNGDKVLVHCAVGASRSVYVVTRALAEIEDKTYGQKFKEVQEKRPIAMYGPLFANL